MRSVVFAAFIMTLLNNAAMAQPSGPPALITRCVNPGNCITVNTGPCGSLLVVEKGAIIVAAPSDDLQTPGIHGFCGFIDSPNAAAAHTSQPVEEHCVGNSCVVPLGGSR